MYEVPISVVPKTEANAYVDLCGMESFVVATAGWWSHTVENAIRPNYTGQSGAKFTITIVNP